MSTEEHFPGCVEIREAAKNDVCYCESHEVMTDPRTIAIVEARRLALVESFRITRAADHIIARKWSLEERIGALTLAEWVKLAKAIAEAPDGMTIKEFVELHPLPVDELGVRRKPQDNPPCPQDNQPCGSCGATNGTFSERGFNRCNACGYPGQ